VLFQWRRQQRSDSAMKEILRKWWEGTYVPPDNDPNSAFVFTMGDHEKHWSSRAAHLVADFWMKYWQWCIGVMLAVIGLILKH
jgi:hypothetical protein